MLPKNNCTKDRPKPLVSYFASLSISYFASSHSCSDLNRFDRRTVWLVWDTWLVWDALFSFFTEIITRFEVTLLCASIDRFFRGRADWPSRWSWWRRECRSDGSWIRKWLRLGHLFRGCWALSTRNLRLSNSHPKLHRNLNSYLPLINVIEWAISAKPATNADCQDYPACSPSYNRHRHTNG